MRDFTMFFLRTAAALMVPLFIAGCGGGGGSGDEDALADAGQIAKETVAADAMPGVATVSLSTKHVRYGASGDRRRGDPRGLQISIFDRFAIGSMTKSMTATLAGILVQENRIRWDSTLYQVLPELAAVGRTEFQNVTLLDLLTHSSGLFPILTAEDLAAAPPLSGPPRQQRVELLYWLVTLAPAIVPGQAVEYSNGGYVAAAAMLERVASQDYESLMADKLFEPLHIDPKFESPPARIETEMTPWPHARMPTTNTWLALDPRMEDLRFPAAGNPAGGLSMRSHELVAYLRMHLRALRGETGLPVSPETARFLHTEVRALQSVGWVKTFDDRRRPISFTAGSDEFSFYAMMALAPDRDRAAIVLTNGYDATTEDKLAAALTKLLD